MSSVDFAKECQQWMFLVGMAGLTGPCYRTSSMLNLTYFTQTPGYHTTRRCPLLPIGAAILRFLRTPFQRPPSHLGVADGPFAALLLVCHASTWGTKWDWDARLQREAHLSSFDVRAGWWSAAASRGVCVSAASLRFLVWAQPRKTTRARQDLFRVEVRV